MQVSSSTHPTHRSDDLTASVLDLLHTVHEMPENMASDVPFATLDFDSLVLVELAVKLSRTHGVEIADAEIIDARTPADVVDLLRSKGVRG
ncbi:acyl carrier protein [Streptomyces alkaliphilus]|nr:acyl carrier protein [Streptomyces alkaliphilus]